MNYDKPDSNIPKSIDQYEGNIDSASPFSALGNVINQSNHVENSTDSKKLLITNNKILNVISKIQQDMYDEQDTSIKKRETPEAKKEESKSVQNIITNMFIENGDTDFNFIGRRRYIPSKDTDEKKRKKEEEKKKEAAQNKKSKDQDKINAQNEKRHKQNIGRHKRTSKRMSALFAMDGALAAGESLIGAGGPFALPLAIAGIAAVAGGAAYSFANSFDAEIDEAGGNSENMNWWNKLSFGLGNNKSQNEELLKQKLQESGSIQTNFFTKDTVKDWNIIGSLSIPELDILAKDRNYSIEDRAKFKFISKLKKGKDYLNSQETLTTFIANNVKGNGKGAGTGAPEKVIQEIKDSDGVKPVTLNGNAKIAMNYFVKQGWSEVQSAAIVGNLMQESGVDPKSVNMSKGEDPKGGGSWGIAQWNKTRKDAFLAEYPQYKTIKEIPLEIQLAYVHKELTSGVAANTGAKLKNMTNLDDATQLVLAEFENPKNKVQPQRQENASVILKDYQKKNKQNETDKQASKDTTAGNTVASKDTGKTVASKDTGKTVASKGTENPVASKGTENPVASKGTENPVASKDAGKLVASKDTEPQSKNVNDDLISKENDTEKKYEGKSTNVIIAKTDTSDKEIKKILDENNIEIEVIAHKNESKNSNEIIALDDSIDKENDILNKLDNIISNYASTTSAQTNITIAQNNEKTGQSLFSYFPA